MDVVCCTDNNYIMPTGVLLCSICENNKSEEIIFHIILNSDISENNKCSLKNVVAKYFSKVICFYVVEHKIPEYFTVNKPGQPQHITSVSYFRLLVTEILPENIDKVIYLDCDIIVRHSLRELYNYDVEKYAVAAVPDMTEGQIHWYNYLRYPQRYGYFNAGVLLINLKYWRDNDMLTQFSNFAKNYPQRIRMHDQDILNYVLHDKKLNLPLKYNFQDGFFYKEPLISWEYEDELEEAIDNPFIIHYTSTKPWMEDCKNPYKEIFFQYQSKTEWKNMPLLKNKQSKKEIIKNILQKIGLLSTPKNLYRDNLRLEQ
jgi:lipopolysaccharide biosynthesis glycosyltransferase